MNSSNGKNGNGVSNNTPPAPSARDERTAPYGVDLFMGPKAKPQQSYGIDLRAIWRYRWSMLLLFALGVAVATTVIWTKVQPHYASKAVIHVASYVPRVIYKTGDNGKMPLYGAYLNTQVSLIQSPDVMQKVVGRSDVQQTDWYQASSAAASGDLAAAGERLARQLVVRERRGTELVDVSLETLDSRESQIIVNAVAEEYKAYWDANQASSDIKRRATLRKQREQLESEISTLFARRYELTEQLGSDIHEDVRTQKHARLNQLRIQLQTLESDKAMRSVVRPANDSASGEQLSSTTAPRALREDETWQTQFASYEDARRRLTLAKQQFGSSHPKYLEIAADVDSARRALKMTEARLMPSGVQANDFANEVEKLREDQLVAAVSELQAELAQTDRMMAELARTEERYKERKLVQKELDDRLHALEMERNAPERVTIQSTGQLRRKPSTDRRNLYTACGIALSFLGAFGAGFIRSRSDRKIHSYQDVSDALPKGVPFLGQLPRARDALGEGEDTLLGRAIRENMRIVRTMLLQKLGNNGGAVVITSPEASSGKTTVSILLARSLAAMGKRTLLVDADLLHPSASRYFELIEQRGLCCAVAGELSDEEAIIPTDNENLFILPTGERHARGNRDVLANGAFAGALQRWKSQFDYVLIDSPPVLAMADARIAASQADGVVMVMRSDGSRREEIVEAFAGLSACGARLLGTMLVGVRHGTAYYPYDYHRRHLDTSELLA